MAKDIIDDLTTCQIITDWAEEEEIYRLPTQHKTPKTLRFDQIDSYIPNQSTQTNASGSCREEEAPCSCPPLPTRTSTHNHWQEPGLQPWQQQDNSSGHTITTTSTTNTSKAQATETAQLHARIATLEGAVGHLTAQIEAIAKALKVTPPTPTTMVTTITKPTTPRQSRPMRRKPPPSPSKAAPTIICRIIKAGATLPKKAELELLKALGDYKTSLFHQCQFKQAMDEGEDADELKSGKTSNDGATDNADDISEDENNKTAMLTNQDILKDANRV